MPVKGAGANAIIPSVARFKSLTIGGITVSNAMIGILTDAASKSFWNAHGNWIEHDPVYGLDFKPAPILLGLDVLSKLHLYIAYGEKALYVTAAGASQGATASIPGKGTANHD